MKAFSCVFFAVAALAPASAFAAEPGLDGPVPYIDRPLTLPELTLAPQVDARVHNINFGGFFGSSSVFSLNTGARFGITDDLEVHATPLSFYAGDADGYGSFHLGMRYRLVAERAFELGLGGGFFAASGDLDVIGMNFGVPMLIRAGKTVRIDTGVYFAGVFDAWLTADPFFALANQGTSAYLLAPDPMIPANFSFQLTPNVYLGADTGVGVGNVEFTDTSLFVPLGFRLGGTIPLKGRPFVDLQGGFRFPAFFTNINRIEPVGTELWEVQVLKMSLYVDFKR